MKLCHSKGTTTARVAEKADNLWDIVGQPKYILRKANDHTLGWPKSSFG